MQETQKRRPLVIALCFGILGVVAIPIVFFWYFALVASHEGSTHDQPVVAAKTLESFRDLEQARAQSKDATSLPSAIQKNIVIVDPGTWVWDKSDRFESAMKVKLLSGKHKGMVVWLRSGDVTIGGSVL
jgi:hypothetical protein